MEYVPRGISSARDVFFLTDTLFSMEDHGKVPKKEIHDFYNLTNFRIMCAICPFFVDLFTRNSYNITRPRKLTFRLRQFFRGRLIKTFN